jgi:hypothetical protein
MPASGQVELVSVPLGRHRPADDQDTKTKFENTATGVGQGVPFKSMTGERADFVILDDPMSVDDANLRCWSPRH